MQRPTGILTLIGGYTSTALTVHYRYYGYGGDERTPRHS